MATTEALKSSGRTPHELFVETLPWFLRCAACLTRSRSVDCVIRVMVMAEPAEYMRRHPKAAQALMQKNYRVSGVWSLPTFPTSFGVPMTMVSDMGACSVHKKALEQAAARNEDWLYVWIERGPEPDGARLVVPVATDMSPSSLYPSITARKVILTGET